MLADRHGTLKRTGYRHHRSPLTLHRHAANIASGYGGRLSHHCEFRLGHWNTGIQAEGTGCNGWGWSLHWDIHDHTPPSALSGTKHARVREF